MIRTIPQPYRQPILGSMDRTMRRALAVASAAGALVLAVVLLAPPLILQERTIEEVPERLARLILEKPKPKEVSPPAEIAVERPVLAEKTPVEKPNPKPEEIEKPPDPKPNPDPKPRRREEAPKLAEDRGKVGREKAKEVEQVLAGTTQKVESTLQTLSASLAGSKSAESGGAKPMRRRGKQVASGRGAGELDTANVGGGATVNGKDVKGTTIIGSTIDIEAISPVGGDLASSDPSVLGDGSGGGGGTPGSGAYRSNASLLAVVRRYAAGVQFCYDNELKRNPGLQGKLVMVLTVLANGRVTDVGVVSDGLGSDRLNECVLAQMREWKFPEIPEGVVTFRTPFVFTPPK